MNKPILLGLFLFATTFCCLNALNNDYVVDELINFYRNGTQGIHASVHYQGSSDYYLKPTSPIIQHLNTTVTFDSDYELTILIDNAEKPRWKMPYESPYPHTKPDQINEPVYDVKIEQNPFSIAVLRTSTGEAIFNTSQFDFIYSDYHVGFGTKVPSKFLYGLGERRRKFLYDTGLYTIWNKDAYAQIDYGQGGQQLYGCHPMYMVRESKTGFWDVVYLRNSYGMDFKFDSRAETLQFFLTGGVIELKFFFGSTFPDQVLKSYHEYIGKWAIMPFWSHGYHQSKYGVLYLDELLEAVNNFTQFQVPIDVIWSDIDYMYSFTDFTIDNDRYNVQKLKELAQKIHWVPIIDAGISLNVTSDAYNLGKKYDVWIKSGNNNTNPLVGVVWPGVVHWVDWQNKNATKYWSELFTKFYKQAPFSGIWLDMNENANFCAGEFNISCFFLDNYLPNPVFPHGNTEIPPGDQDPNLPPSKWAWFNSSALPYIPGGWLEDKSISINAIHSDGLLEHDLHNLNGFQQTQATYEVLQTLIGKRPFILSRSTHVGSGQFAAHWSGDNAATWEFLKLSIPCVFNFQLFGMPMTGDDVCGFAGDTTVELCARWMQLGALYPFMRNHMALGTRDHYPWSLGDTVLQATKASLTLRYSILKYYYSLFVNNDGKGTVFRPLFFDFPEDTALLNLETQFMIGSALMAAPIVDEGKKFVSVYFPGGQKWYDFATGKLIFDLTNKRADSTSFNVPLNGTAPLFIRGGFIIPVQNTSNVTSTKDLKSPLNFIVALSKYSDNCDTAHGNFLGIANYSSEASIDKCVDGKNCNMFVSISSVINTDGTVRIAFIFLGDTGSSTLEKGVYVDGFTIYGMRTTVSCPANDEKCLGGNDAITCSFGKPFEVAKEATGNFIWDGKSCVFKGLVKIEDSEDKELLEMRRFEARDLVTEISQ